MILNLAKYSVVLKIRHLAGHNSVHAPYIGIKLSHIFPMIEWQTQWSPLDAYFFPFPHKSQAKSNNKTTTKYSTLEIMLQKWGCIWVIISRAEVNCIGSFELSLLPALLLWDSDVSISPLWPYTTSVVNIGLCENCWWCCIYDRIYTSWIEVW